MPTITKLPVTVKYNVTFKFNLPIRPDKTVTVEVDADADADVITETGQANAIKRHGIEFGPYAYGETPVKVELV